MFDNEPIEYRVIYHWDKSHWTCITSQDIPVDLHKYIKNNLAEMQDAIDDDPAENYFSIELYIYGALVHTWQGTPEELLKISKDITDEWLSHAFE